MRILILTNDDEGLYKFRKELVETLLKDNEVFISLPYGKYVDYFKEKGVHFIDTIFNRKGTNPIKDIKLVFSYKKIIEDVKPNVVLLYTVKPTVYGGIACQKEKIPYIVNITGISSAIENGGIVGKIVEYLYKIGLKKADKVFFQNSANREFMKQKGIVNKNDELLPGSGVNTNEYKLLQYPSDDTIDFVYVARIMKEKGIEEYLKAAEYIRNKYQNTRFHICGTYDDLEYERKVNELSDNNTVIYHGSVENMNEIYKNVHCVIHPSFYSEGMSNTLLEALACGRPIITTDRPGCKELVENNKNGYLIKQKDSNDLINKIELFLSLSNDQRKKMGVYGRSIIENKYDRNIVVNKYIETIKEITNG